jgi:hypothetical protein
MSRDRLARNHRIQMAEILGWTDVEAVEGTFYGTRLRGTPPYGSRASDPPDVEKYDTDYVEAKAYLARQGWEIITETRERSSVCRILTEKAARAQESSRAAGFMGIEYILSRSMEYADIAHRERKCFLLAVLSAVAQDKMLDQAGG